VSGGAARHPSSPVGVVPHFPALSESLVITLSCVIRLLIEEMSFRYEEYMSVVLVGDFRQLAVGRVWRSKGTD